MYLINICFVREKKLLVASDDYGRDLTGVQNLLKKHKRLEAELASHEPAIQAVQEAGEKLMDVSNLGVPEIEQRLKALGLAWSELQALADERGAKLQQSLAYQQFLAKVDEEEAWIRCVRALSSITVIVNRSINWQIWEQKAIITIKLLYKL